MSENCDKGPVLDLIVRQLDSFDKKLDTLAQAVTNIAVTSERVDELSRDMEKIDTRLIKIEGTPHRILYSIFTLVLTIVGMVVGKYYI